MKRLFILILQNEKLEYLLKKILHKYPSLRGFLAKIRNKLLSQAHSGHYSIKNTNLLETIKNDVNNKRKAIK